MDNKNYMYSKSTRVSPSRCNQQYTNQTERFNQHNYQNQSKQQYQQQTARHEKQHHKNSYSQFNIRIPQQNINSQINVEYKPNKSSQKSLEGFSYGYDDVSVEDPNMMHESFINLIYPSKSKKLISNENQKTKQNKSSLYHQKSKSLFIGDLDNQAQAIYKNNKKNQQPFNYQQRMREILKEPEYTDVARPQKVFSQQNSPTQAQQNLMIGTMDTTLYQQQQSIQQQPRVFIKNTFDMGNNHNQNSFQKVNDPHKKSSHAIYTFDQSKQRRQHQKSFTSQNTPSNISQINQQHNEITSSHMQSTYRKPTNHTKTNSLVDYEYYKQPVRKDSSNKTQRSKERSKEKEQPQYVVQQPFPQREKKQQQPTQSKNVQQKPNGKGVHHERSQSDYTEQISQFKLNKYLNCNSFAEPNQQKINENTLNMTPISTDRSNAILKQYSYARLEQQSIEPTLREYQKNVKPSKQKKNSQSFKSSYLEQTQLSSKSKVDQKSIYHERKHSYQPNSQILHGKKSPRKTSFIYKEPSQKINQSRKSSPKLQQTQKQTVTTTASNQGKTQRSNQYPASQKQSTLTSPIGNKQTNVKHQNKDNIGTHQHNKLSFCNNYAGNPQKALMKSKHQRSKSDINQNMIDNAQIVKERKSSISSNSNKQQIKKQQNQFVNSEKVSPRKQFYQNYMNLNQASKQRVANVQIDLSQIGTTLNQPSISHKSITQKSTHKPIIYENNQTQMQQQRKYNKDSFTYQDSKQISPKSNKKNLSKSTVQKNTSKEKLNANQNNNSPRQTLFQKAMQMKQQSILNNNNSVNIITPNSNSNSFVKSSNQVNNRYQAVDISDDSLIIPQHIDSQTQKNTNRQIQPKNILNFYDQEKQQQKEIDQIRNIDFVSNQVDLNEESHQIPQEQPLFKITEKSFEQNIVDTVEDQQKNQLSYRQKKPQLNLNNFDTQQIYLTTDPNMSPYSKDCFKLKKLIKVSFKKYNEPPTTTSEFYRIGRVLGRGAFGKVNLASHKISEQLVAIKSINKQFLKSEDEQRKKIMQEVAILKQSNHPSIVRLYDSFETNKHICFVMELCTGGDLLSYVRKRRKLKEDTAKYFFKQLIEGLAYLHHSKLIIHRDIKLDNILLDANGKIKICDFGVSKQVQNENERMTEQCGTPAYIAPEIIRDKGYEGFKPDVWSAGVCLYAMLIGTVPFKAASMHELHHMIINGKYDLKEEKLSDEVKDLISKLLQVDQRKRISACEVLGHPWLKDAQEHIDIFTQKEKDLIKKEYLTKNIERNHRQSQIQQTNQDTDVLFTEHNLDTKTNGNSLLKNASTKSIILAPFNSTVSGYDEENQDDKEFEWPQEVKQLLVKKKIIKFAPNCRDLDRQYEHNNNADLDNGVYNDVMNEQEQEDNMDNSQRSDGSSSDSLKKSFKNTELSSDDEKVDKQVEQAQQNKNKQSELQEFEKQIKQKYVKYQEPIHEINQKVIEQIVSEGIYPREYLIKEIKNKEMNYATAAYNLLLKKQQLQQLFQQ